jgi:hypothetical protein
LVTPLLCVESDKGVKRRIRTFFIQWIYV